jgi:hypothetical protein
MDFPGAKAPPRYVPTLTDIVTDSDPEIARETAPDEAAAQSLAWDELPAREAVPAPLPLASALDAAGAPAFPVVVEAAQVEVLEPEALEEGPLDDEAAAQAEERLVQRLLERVELGLDQRLRDTIAQVVQEQTRSVTLRLQEALESVVRQTVQEALAQERAPGQRGAQR